MDMRRQECSNRGWKDAAASTVCDAAELTSRLDESVFVFRAAVWQAEEGGSMAAIVREPSRIGWRFWIYWMLATIAGAAAYMIAVVPLSAIMAATPRSAEMPVVLAIGALGTALLGAFLGLGQWLVLRRYLPRSGGWIVATLFGYSIPLSSGMVYAGGPPALGPVVMGLEFGLGLGVLQWLVLRTRVYQAGWWIPISIAGWALAFSLTGVVYLSGIYIEPMDLLFALLIPVAVTGAGLVWLLRRQPRVGAA
jgi:hypothetical protein